MFRVIWLNSTCPYVLFKSISNPSNSVIHWPPTLITMMHLHFYIPIHICITLSMNTCAPINNMQFAPYPLKINGSLTQLQWYDYITRAIQEAAYFDSIAKRQGSNNDHLLTVEEVRSYTSLKEPRKEANYKMREDHWKLHTKSYSHNVHIHCQII